MLFLGSSSHLFPARKFYFEPRKSILAGTFQEGIDGRMIPLLLQSSKTFL